MVTAKKKSSLRGLYTLRIQLYFRVTYRQILYQSLPSGSLLYLHCLSPHFCVKTLLIISESPIFSARPDHHTLLLLIPHHSYFSSLIHIYTSSMFSLYFPFFTFQSVFTLVHFLFKIYTSSRLYLYTASFLSQSLNCFTYQSIFTLLHFSFSIYTSSLLCLSLHCFISQHIFKLFHFSFSIYTSSLLCLSLNGFIS